MKNAYISMNFKCIQTIIQLSGHAYVNYLLFMHHYNNLSLMEPAIMCVLNFLTNAISDFFSDSTFYHIIPDNGSSITNACLPNVLMKKCDMIMF